jgi:CRISPR-associated protein Csb1
MKIEDLKQAVSTGSMIRLAVDLSPMTSDGLVFPPTYAAVEKNGPPHIDFRRAWVDGALRDVVVLDSVQSQANRVEQALLSAKASGRLAYPDIRVTFPADSGEPVYSVLQLSHRVFDVTLACATLGGVPFFESATGKSLRQSNPNSATSLFEHAPATLFLGAWDSHGGGGPLVAKLPRLLTSEIIGLDAVPVNVSAMKSDPMDIRKNAAELFEAAPGSERTFELEPSSPKEKGKKPSEFGFGSVPAVNKPRAASISVARQTSLISCSGLRQLRFPGGAEADADRRNHAARIVLAALGLYGLLAQNESGYRLRSRCELVPVGPAKLEVIGRSLQDVQAHELSSDQALALLDAALAEAKVFGLQWLGDLDLQADDRLVALVARSRAAVGPTAENDD